MMNGFRCGVEFETFLKLFCPLRKKLLNSFL